MTANAYTEDGIDVTRLVGEAFDRAMEEAFDRFRAAHAENAERPSVRSARALVRAYEEYEAFVMQVGK